MLICGDRVKTNVCRQCYSPALVGGPEPVLVVQVARPRLAAHAALGRLAAGFLYDHPVQTEVQHIVSQRLVRPRVVQRRGHVHVPVQNDQQHSLETET